MKGKSKEKERRKMGFHYLNFHSGVFFFSVDEKTTGIFSENVGTLELKKGKRKNESKFENSFLKY